MYFPLNLIYFTGYNFIDISDCFCVPTWQPTHIIKLNIKPILRRQISLSYKPLFLAGNRAVILIKNRQSTLCFQSNFYLTCPHYHNGSRNKFTN